MHCRDDSNSIHAFSRVAEKVRSEHPTVDLFLANFKQILKNAGRRADYKRKTGLPLPPIPILTRWTTWLEAAQYVAIHLGAIKDYLRTLNTESNALRKLLSLFDDNDDDDYELADEFVSLHDFYFLIDKTKQIQEESMRIEDAWEISSVLLEYRLLIKSSRNHSEKIRISSS